MTIKLLLLLITAVILLQGCSAVRENRIRQETLADNNLSMEIRKAIELKELVKGMTQNQVIASWGLPCKWCFGTRKSSGGDTWEYNLLDFGLFGNGSDVSLGSGTYVFFDHRGILKHWAAN